jgi:hypothetical protein
MNWDASRRVGAELHSVAFNGDYVDYHGPILQIDWISVPSDPLLWLCRGLPDGRPGLGLFIPK